MCIKVQEAAEKEWEAFRAERTAGVDEIQQLRQRVIDEEERKKSDQPEARDQSDSHDVKMEDAANKTTADGAEPKGQRSDTHEGESKSEASLQQENGAQMEVDDEAEPSLPAEPQKAQGQTQSEGRDRPPSATLTVDEDDAVEY